MLQTSYSKKWSIVAFFIGICILFFYLKDGIFSINSWLYHVNGDALKNYYNVLLSAKYSNGLWLNSVNYPHGEQLFYLDAQPLLAKFLMVFGLENYSIGFINILPLISIPLTIIPVFLIQRTIKIPLFINIFTAIIIAFLSPQIVRIQVHFALAYSFFIPMLVYILIVNFKKPLFKYLLLTIILTAFSFLHPYYLLIGIVLLASYLAYHLFFQFSKKEFVYNIMAILIPLIIVKLTLILSDTVTDRPEFPWGIWKYRSTFESVFFPRFKPFTELISTPLGLNGGTFEGNAYVGVLGFFALVYTGISLIIKKYKKQSVSTFFRTEKFFYLFFASLIIWIFALYYPLKALIDPILELIPALKQFRSLGRFGWVFYYLFSIVITINLSNLFECLRKRFNLMTAFTSLLVLFSIWFIDANANLNLVKNAISNRHVVDNNKSNHLTDLELEKLFTENKFDAILSLPIFSVGSEIENYEGSGLCLFETYKISNLKNKPYISTFSSRVSSSQFQKIKELKFKGNLRELFKGKSLLIVADVNDLNEIEQDILMKAKILYEKGNLVYGTYYVE